MLESSGAGEGCRAAAMNDSWREFSLSINIPFTLSRWYSTRCKSCEDDSRRGVMDLSCRCKIMARFPHSKFGAECRKFSA